MATRSLVREPPKETLRNIILYALKGALECFHHQSHRLPLTLHHNPLLITPGIERHLRLVGNGRKGKPLADNGRGRDNDKTPLQENVGEKPWNKCP